MRILLSILILSYSAINCDQTSDELTQALHVETISLKSSPLKKETCPILFALLSRLTEAADVAMPQRISVHNAEYTKVDKKTGIIEKRISYIRTYLDIFGDLVIYREIFDNCSYQEFEGILAIAIAEKANDKTTKQILAGVGTVAATVLVGLGLKKYSHFSLAYHQVIGGGIHFGFYPAWLVSAAVGRCVQKTSTINALTLTNPAYVRDGVKALSRIREMYYRPTTVEKAFALLDLRKVHEAVGRSLSENNPEETLLNDIDTYTQS